MKTTTNSILVFNRKEIRNICRKKRANLNYFSYFVNVFCGLLSAAIFILNIFFPYLFLFTVPFLIVPLLFAAQVGNDFLNKDQNISIGNIFRCLFLYFTERFRSSFSILKSLAIFVISYLSVFITSFILFYSLAYSYNFCGFKDMVYSLSKLQYLTNDAIRTILNSYSRAFNYLTLSTMLPSLSISSLLFFYFSSKSGTFLPIRINADIKYKGKYISYVSNQLIRNNRKLFFKCIWTVNWPVYSIALAGFLLGGYIGYLYSFDAISIFTFGIALSIFLSYGVYGPMYYSNKVGICEYLLPLYQNEEIKYQTLINNQFTNILNQLQKMKDDTKKDSHES